MFNLKGPQGQNPRITVWETLPYGNYPVLLLESQAKFLSFGKKREARGRRPSGARNGKDRWWLAVSVSRYCSYLFSPFGAELAPAFANVTLVFRRS